MARFTRGLVLGLLLTSHGLAQGSPQGARLTDNPYNSLLNDAKQVIVHVPKLSDGNLVNALKVAMNLSVPIRVLTTNTGMMQENGLIMRLVVLDLPVYPLKSGGDRRMFMMVENKDGWAVFDISSGRPVKRRMADYNAFASWYGQNIRKLPVYSPSGVVTVWTKAHLGYNLTAGSIQIEERQSKAVDYRLPPSK